MKTDNSKYRVKSTIMYTISCISILALYFIDEGALIAALVSVLWFLLLRGERQDAQINYLLQKLKKNGQ